MDERFVLPESYQDDEPRPAQGLRDWWWSGTRAQRWAASLGVPLAVVVLVATSVALASGDNEQPIAESDTTTTTSDRPSVEAVAAIPTPIPTPGLIANVTSIESGDTIVVLHDGAEQTIRLIGIDAPDVSGSNGGQQCWGTESRRFASQTLLQQEIRLMPDATQGDTDSSGAALAYVLLPDGRDFSVLSAGAGQSRSHTTNTPAAKAAEIDSAEEVARTASVGLWGAPCNGRLTMPRTTTTPTTTQEPAPSDTPVPTTSPPPTTTTETPPPDDPRFANCAVARAKGYGPYRQGIDPEYEWYNDLDADGIVCERDNE